MMKHQYNQKLVGANACWLFAFTTALSNLWNYHLTNEDLKDMYISTGRNNNWWLPIRNMKQALTWWNNKFKKNMLSRFISESVNTRIEKWSKGIIVIHLRINNEMAIDVMDWSLDKLPLDKTTGWHAMCLVYENGKYLFVDNYLWVKRYNEYKVTLPMIRKLLHSGLLRDTCYYVSKY